MDRKENQRQNQIPIRNGGKPNQITSDSSMLQMHSKAAIKLDHTVDYFKCLEGETKQVVNRFNYSKSKEKIKLIHAKGGS